MSIDDLLFRPIGNESKEAFEKRLLENERTFRNVFANESGHKLLNLLTQCVNPTYPRFAVGVSPEMAAFRDGQGDIIATLIRRGTNIWSPKLNNDQQ